MYCKDTRESITVVRNLINKDAAADGIYDETDIGYDTADFDVGFIFCEYVFGLIIIMINKGMDEDDSCFAVVGDLLMEIWIV
ncbi:MAG: hypothetical protein ACI4DZ_06515 [Oliverpabstia sp.]